MKVVAHRGFCGVYPENTMLSYRQAVLAKCDEIELDVQLTSDGTVVVIHDEKVDRTTDGVGNVRDYTFKELQKLNAANLYKDKFAFEAIPSFEEYCEWAKTVNSTTNVELKTGLVYYPEIEQKTIDIIHRFGLEKKVMFSSFNHLSLITTKKIAPEIPVGALVDHVGLVNAGYYCAKYGFEFYHPGYKGLNDQIVAELKAYHIGMNVWTVNGMAELEQLYQWGVNGVISNYPSVCRHYLDGLRKQV
ncbi:MAG: glycerophosphodiester phosphodiesterase [Sphaerochaetaceae bacterium]